MSETQPGTPPQGVPGRDLDTAGFDSSLGDESTGGDAARESVGAEPGDVEAPEPTE
jgi:hypothetical protein